MKTNYIYFLFLLGLISCSEEIPVLKQKIYFEKHYVNMAWIPQSTGFLVDSTGNVLQFSWVEVFHIWYDPDSTGMVSSSNMDKNISYCQPAVIHINADTLKHYVDKIYEASKGKVSDPQHVMADAGTTTYSAFIFDPKTNRYKQVLLKTDGDISTTNSAPAADEIYQWLKRIGK
ncbi:MAG: hypothetical protein PHT07_00170 [Paludibacter sp.]|nr:hypothetical protein [Paludibacter sp.]